jgi:hypothetical protein
MLYLITCSVIDAKKGQWFHTSTDRCPPAHTRRPEAVEPMVPLRGAGTCTNPGTSSSCCSRVRARNGTFGYGNLRPPLPLGRLE